MTIIEALRIARETVARIDPEIALGESEEILEYITGLDRVRLHLQPSRILDEDEEDRLGGILRRRSTGEPLPYVLGRVWFHSRFFSVTSDVLIPRPETEVLVETVLQRESEDERFFADLGVGCGCIAATLVHCRPRWLAAGVDLSRRALAVARRNCPAAVALLCGDLLTSVKSLPVFDFVVSNPPYISDRAMQLLDSSVRDFEPPVALRGGPDGTDFYARIAAQARAILKPGGRVYCEIGYDQGASVPRIFAAQDWVSVSVYPDLAGRPRVMRAVRT